MIHFLIITMVSAVAYVLKESTSINLLVEPSFLELLLAMDNMFKYKALVSYFSLFSILVLSNQTA